MRLQDLVRDFGQTKDEELEQEGRALYATLLLNQGNRGIHQTHDGGEVVFFADRFDHAFYDKPSKYHSSKSYDVPSRKRLECLPFIIPLIEGKVPGSECWEHMPRAPGQPRRRVYVHWDPAYVVWLEPRPAGGWKFSSAYPMAPSQVRDYTRGARKIASFVETPRD